MTSDEVYQLIIVGTGPAGLTAAIFASRARLKTLVLEGPNPGGQLMKTSIIENWPGEEKISGFDLMRKLYHHAQQLGVIILGEEAITVDFSTKPFHLWTTQGTKLTGQSIIIATGSIPIKLHCPGEQEYWGKGVSTCAICDGALYANKPVVVVGGGDSSVEHALFLMNFTDKIYVIQLASKLTAKAALQEKLLHNKKIKIVYNSTISEIKGDGKQITKVIITNHKTDEKYQIKANGVFLSIGLKPNTKIFRNQIALDKKGYVQTKNRTHTSVEGIFAAGDIIDPLYRQAITAAGSGCVAALDAQAFLNNIQNPNFKKETDSLI